ncbi:MAG: BolA family protein [Pseudomonadota bacterium]
MPLTPTTSKPLESTALEDIMYQKIMSAVKPETLKIINESHLHAGHQSSSQNGRSHFRIKMRSKDMQPLSRLERQRKIYQILDDEMQTIHALAIEITV